MCNHWLFCVFVAFVVIFHIAYVLCILTLNRESLIDVTIETAVSSMQTVVELGRVIRDRRTLPMKACGDRVVFSVRLISPIFGYYRHCRYFQRVRYRMRLFHWVRLWICCELWLKSVNNWIMVAFSIRWKRLSWFIKMLQCFRMLLHCKTTLWRWLTCRHLLT